MKAFTFLLVLLLCLPCGVACVFNSSFENGRYRDNEISTYVNCGSSAADDCYYKINDFANVTISNCSNATILGELGWNRMTLCGSNGSWNCSDFNFWSKKQDGSTSSDYAVIIITLVISVGLFLLGGFLNARIFWFLAGIGGLVLGYEMLAFSMLSGVSVVVCSALFCMAIMFRRGGV